MSDVDGDRSSSVFVEFRTSYVCQHEDLCVALSGSLDELGNWDVRNAVLAEETPEDSGHWQVAVELPAETSFEWKWVVIWRENLTAFRWEERSNRIYDTGYSDGYIRVKALWNIDGITWDDSDDNQLEELSKAIDTDQSENGSFISKIINWIGNRLWNMFNNILLIFR